MKVLFIGGTGNISTECIQPALNKGFELFVYNRGNNNDTLPSEVNRITGDIRDFEQSREILSSYQFDVVVDWVAFTVKHIEQDIALFSGKAGQYIFISSASAYQKPLVSPVITESTPLHNPYWEYSRNKTAAEERLIKEYREKGFPVTIVRPSHTYGRKAVPCVFDNGQVTIPRLQQGKEIIVPGDGTSWWVVTHATDFAKAFTGLLGKPGAIGQPYHITSDEALTWDQITTIVAGHVGVEPKIVHIPADVICSQFPEFEGPLKGDKINSVLFDNTKIKRLVPEFICSTPFHIGSERSVKWLIDNPPNPTEASQELDRKMDAILEAHK